LCKPLIKGGFGNTVDFVHFSTKEYILKQEYRNARPFIKTECAHLNISFPRVSYLNTSFSLLPSNCTDQQRAAIILQGFYSLQFYTNQFWLKHVLSCCGLFVKTNIAIPNNLLTQLERLLKFRKAIENKSGAFINLENSSPSHQRGGSMALNRLLKKVGVFFLESH
jgi:hypothetical protein